MRLSDIPLYLLGYRHRISSNITYLSTKMYVRFKIESLSNMVSKYKYLVSKYDGIYSSDRCK